MFCKKCGQEINDEAVVCVHCGCAIEGKSADGNAKSWIATLLLCIFLGGLGIHRFYVGKSGSGVAMLLITLLLGWLGIGLIITGIWAIVDLIMICTGDFKAADGSALQK